MKRAVVVLLETVDEAIDSVAYRPAVVKAFAWAPRWWRCELAKLSIRLDDRWHVGHWQYGRPGGLCEACGRRAAWHEIGGAPWDDVEAEEPAHDASFLADRSVALCAWCRVGGPINGEEDLQRELARARKESISCRWRLRRSG
jgi:hypothetical protein